MCAGGKTWWFLPPDCCNDFGHHFFNGATLGKGFPPEASITRVRTEPGDVLVTGPYEHHIVLTDPGPNFMQTYRIFNRKVLMTGIKRFGLMYLKSLFDFWKNNKKGTTANQAYDEKKGFRKHCINDMSAEDLRQLTGKDRNSAVTN